MTSTGFPAPLAQGVIPEADRAAILLAGRKALYADFSLLADWLKDGFRSGGPVPELAPLQDTLSERSGAGLTPTASQPPWSAGAARAYPPGTVIQAAQDRPVSVADNPALMASPVGAADSLALIQQEIGRCLKCRLAGSRQYPVPGQGVARPLVLVLGEAPDAADNGSGQAFSGAAGQLLDRMLAAIGLSRDTNCFLAPLVRCYPPAGRDPVSDEQLCCAPYLRRQLHLLQPKAILALGRIPAQFLLNSREGLAKLRGSVYQFEGLPLVVTHSIGRLLLDESLKRPAWEDLKLLRGALPHA